VKQPLTVWLLNPYHTGSHRAWAEGYAAHSRHRVRILSLPGYFWKWRMQGGALELAEQAHGLLAAGERPDLLLATSMVNLPAFFALTRRALGGIPTLLYMHENQLTYPPPPGAKRDLTYGMIQHLSMLAADRVCFNSAYHMQSWFAELPRLLKHFPDYTHEETIGATQAKSSVLPVGCDLRRLDKYLSENPLWPVSDRARARSETGPQQWQLDKVDSVIARSAIRDATSSRAPGIGDCFAHTARNDPPLILWNQRWEYDKDPETMLRALYALADAGLNFRVALAGENFRVQPAEFAAARLRLGGRLVHYGYAENEADYIRLLWRADVVLSTAIHEFFGVSIVEAIYCGCLPVLPRRLSYPELIPAAWHDRCLYDDFEGLLARLRAAVADPQVPQALRAAVARFDWSAQAALYDALMDQTATA
jgi:glycosyltransferase involved in cell wall biosynthesis